MGKRRVGRDGGKEDRKSRRGEEGMAKRKGQGRGMDAVLPRTATTSDTVNKQIGGNSLP